MKSKLPEMNRTQVKKQQTDNSRNWPPDHV